MHFYIKRSLEPKMSYTFFITNIWAPTVSLPLDKNERLVPHLKDLIHICLEPEA